MTKHYPTSNLMSNKSHQAFVAALCAVYFKTKTKPHRAMAAEYFSRAESSRIVFG
jgi:hypothetical protein